MYVCVCDQSLICKQQPIFLFVLFSKFCACIYIYHAHRWTQQTLQPLSPTPIAAVGSLCFWNPSTSALVAWSGWSRLTFADPGSSLWQYSPSLNSWFQTSLPTAPLPRISAAGAMFDSRFVYVFSGLMASYVAPQDTWKFDMLTLQWQQMFPFGAMPPGRRGHTCNALGDKMIMYGGESSSDYLTVGG